MTPFLWIQCLGNDGVEFYSVRWNGKDDSGFPGDLPRDRGLFNDERMPDDVLWRVEGSEETLPVVLTEPEKEEDIFMKYGLLPYDAEFDGNDP